VRDALWIYLAAGVLSVAPFSETVVRLPSACAGVLNVVLIFLAARELFGRTRPAAIAAGLLAIMPAHFMQSRTATSQIGTVTCTLRGCCSSPATSMRPPSRSSASTCCLALAFYVYAAAFVIMPIYFLVTLVVIRLHRVEPRSKPAFIAACGGFFSRSCHWRCGTLFIRINSSVLPRTILRASTTRTSARPASSAERHQPSRRLVGLLQSGQAVLLRRRRSALLDAVGGVLPAGRQSANGDRRVHGRTPMED
jgi:hypothetical protein